jgi:hypothetical protein
MANLAALIKKAQDEAKRKAQDEAKRKAQDEAKRKAQAEAATAAAEKKAQEEAKQKDIIKTPEILNNRISQPLNNRISQSTSQPLNNRISQPVSISTIGNEIQKQKQQIDTNLKLLTSAAIAGSGLLAGGLTSFAKSSNGMNNNQTFSKENRTSVKNLYVIMPDANTNKKYIKNPNYKQFVTDYGCQIVPFKFYNKDAQLTEYEKFFNDNKSACVPMALAMDYFRKIQNDDE